VIEQAKGILAVVCGVDPEEAFALLRQRSMDVNVPIRELARHVVDRAHDRAVRGDPAELLA
jgi:AmiR/NasT family two-component response regulator